MKKLKIPKKLEEFTPFFETTKTQFISIETQEEENILEDKDTIEKSKIGGIPYFPINKPYPYILDKPAKIIVQINFAQLFKDGLTLDNFPTTGILQFYAPNNDIFLGYNLDRTNNIKVVYHENMEQFVVTEEMRTISNDNTNMPFEESLVLSFFKNEEYLGHSDRMAVKRFNMDLSKELEDDDELMDYYAAKVDNSGSKLGGYPFFIQSDVRNNTKLELLLQIDSDDNFMLGDSGVAKWFITKEDLIARNFDNVFFSWDCC